MYLSCTALFLVALATSCSDAETQEVLCEFVVKSTT